MTTLANKLQEVAKQLQSLTIWRPNERDPLLELERWRAEAHLTIDQLYKKKKHDIEQLCEKHEREFLRQLARLRASFNNVHQKLAGQRDTNAHVRTFRQNTIFNELQTIENDINTKLGRAEIQIETMPLNCDGLVSLGLKTYLFSSPLMFSKHTPWKNESLRPPRRAASEVQRAYDDWLLEKKANETVLREEALSARQRQRSAQDERAARKQYSKAAFDKWRADKQAAGAFKKEKQLRDELNDSEQQANDTRSFITVE